jgi:hypothetical protein
MTSRDRNLFGNRPIIPMVYPPAPLTTRREFIKGSVMQLTGLALFLSGGTGALFAHERSVAMSAGRAGVLCFEAIAALGGLVFFLGPMLYNTSWTTARGPGSRAVADRLLLYLRPFELDVRTALQLSFGLSTGALLHLMLSLDPGRPLEWPDWLGACAIPLFIRIGEEHRLQRAFGSFGSLVTFGYPGRRLQPMGAWRYQATRAWKREAIRFMRTARLVIFHPGDTESIRWELHRLVMVVPPEKIVFYIRFRGWKQRKRRAWDSFRSDLQSLMGVELPPEPGRADFLLIGRDGKPRFFAPNNRPGDVVRQLLSGNFDRERLRPVFAALGEGFELAPLPLREKVFGILLWEQKLVYFVYVLVVGVIGSVVILAYVIILALTR